MAKAGLAAGLNPFAEGLSEYRSADPALMVIFGATGDLSHRKLLPALYNLARNRLLPAGFGLVGAAIDDLNGDQFRRLAAAHVKSHSRTQPVDERTLEGFIKELAYVPVDFAKADHFKQLGERLEELDDT